MIIHTGCFVATPPDIVLLGAVWPERALLRAQLFEEGYDVVAIVAWPMPAVYCDPGTKPRLLIVDLQRLPHPRVALDEIRLVMVIWPAFHVNQLALGLAGVREFSFLPPAFAAGVLAGVTVVFGGLALGRLARRG
jgi:hypothetical protein